jgi:hypothetical protein
MSWCLPLPFTWRRKKNQLPKRRHFIYFYILSGRWTKSRRQLALNNSRCNANSFFFSMACQPLGGLDRLIFRRFTITHSRHTTLDRTPLDEWSARRTQHSQQTDIHALGGIRTHNPSKRAAVDRRLRRHGHWDRPQPHRTRNLCRMTEGFRVLLRTAC